MSAPPANPVAASVADVVAFLCSSQANFITQIVDVNSGFLMD